VDGRGAGAATRGGAVNRLVVKPHGRHRCVGVAGLPSGADAHGFVEGQNVSVVYRSDLVGRGAAVIAAVEELMFQVLAAIIIPAHNRNRLGRNCPGSAGSMEAAQTGSAPVVICKQPDRSP
jgi:hypothetical protein